MNNNGIKSDQSFKFSDDPLKLDVPLVEDDIYEMSMHRYVVFGTNADGGNVSVEVFAANAGHAVRQADNLRPDCKFTGAYIKTK